MGEALNSFSDALGCQGRQPGPAEPSVSKITKSSSSRRRPFVGRGSAGLARAGIGVLVVTAAAVLGSAGCGYHLRGSGTFLPPSIRTLSIPVFRNLTTRYELDVKLTRAVIDEMVARARITIVPDAAKADAVLEGEVLSFNANPVAFNNQARADNYNITVVAKITLTERVTKKTIFSNPSFIYNQAYDVPQGRDFESVQTEALDLIAEKFARSLVATILEGF